MSRHATPVGKEHPYSHPIQMAVFIVLLVTWALDSFVYRFSTFLASDVPLAVRLAFAVPCFAVGSVLLNSSLRAVFHPVHQGIIEEGVYGLVRHPMYLGHMLVYLSGILATLSLSSLLLWVVGFAMYDRLASYEEEDLIAVLGDSYVAYRQKVPKWLPGRARRDAGRVDGRVDER